MTPQPEQPDQAHQPGPYPTTVSTRNSAGMALLLAVVAAIGVTALGVVIWQLADGGADDLVTAVSGDGDDADDDADDDAGSVEFDVADQADEGSGAEVPSTVAFGFETGPGSAPGMGNGIGSGADDAPVVVEIFQDFMCPHCAAFEAETGAFLAEQVQDGTVRLVRYPMTLSGFGVPTIRAANAYGCAADADAGEELNTLLYEWFGQEWDDPDLVGVGVHAGLESERIEDCLAADTFDAWVTSVNDAAHERGVGGTPTVFVDGELLRPDAGDWGTALDTAIEAAAQ